MIGERGPPGGYKFHGTTTWSIHWKLVISEVQMTNICLLWNEPIMSQLWIYDEDSSLKFIGRPLIGNEVFLVLSESFHYLEWVVNLKLWVYGG